jgi:hypothetical protein
MDGAFFVLQLRQSLLWHNCLFTKVK